jgi:hypothetical protein
MTTLRPEGYQRRQEQVAGWSVNVVSYKLGDRYLCEVDNVSPGARIARAEGATRDEAERRALDDAARRLGRTRTFTAE